MKSKITLIAIIAAIVYVVICIVQNYIIKDLKATNASLELNYTTILAERNSILTEKQRYKTKDSLNAIQLGELEMSLAQYKKYRAEDLKLIKSLGVKNKELEKVVNTQLKTISTLSTKLRDTILISEGALDTLKYFDYKSLWTDVNGLINLSNNDVKLEIANRESLTIVEATTYKRFLGFLWYTSQVEKRDLKVVSKNPNTDIIDVDVISIRR